MRFKNDDDSTRFLVGQVLSDSMNSEKDRKMSAYLADIVGKAFQLYVMHHVTWNVYKLSVVHSIIVRFSDKTDMKQTVLKHLMRHVPRMEEIACQACDLTESDKKHLLSEVVFFFESSGRAEYAIGPGMTDSTASCLMTITNCEETLVPIVSMVWYREGVHEGLFSKLCHKNIQKTKKKQRTSDKTDVNDKKKRKEKEKDKENTANRPFDKAHDEVQSEAQSVVAMASYMKRINGVRTLVTPSSPEEIRREKEAEQARKKGECEGERNDTKVDASSSPVPHSTAELKQSADDSDVEKKNDVEREREKQKQNEERASVNLTEIEQYEKYPAEKVIKTVQHTSSTVVVIPTTNTSVPSSADAAPLPCKPLHRSRLVARLPGRPYNRYVIAV
jgi:hypothetical protein